MRPAADCTLMPHPAKAEDGFGLIELIVAMAVLSIALLALLAGYGSAVVGIRQSSEKTVASSIADAQLELYRALPFASVGLDRTAVANAESTDTVYESDDSALADPLALLPPVDVTIANCASTLSAAGCSPIQTVTGADHRSYRLETFIQDSQDGNSSSTTWTERLVTVIVRDPNTAGTPIVFEASTGFDRGP